MATDEKIHFGWFVRACRDRKHWSQRKFAGIAGFSDRRLSDIEQMPLPDEVSGETHAGIAKACDFVLADGEGDVEAFDLAWKSTPVPKPEFKEPTVTRKIKSSDIAAALNWLGDKEYIDIEPILSKVDADVIDNVIENLTTWAEGPQVVRAPKKKKGKDKGEAA